MLRGGEEAKENKSVSRLLARVYIYNNLESWDEIHVDKRLNAQRPDTLTPSPFIFPVASFRFQRRSSSRMGRRCYSRTEKSLRLYLSLGSRRVEMHGAWTSLSGHTIKHADEKTKQQKKRPGLFPVIASSFQNIREREKKTFYMAKERKQTSIAKWFISVSCEKAKKKKPISETSKRVSSWHSCVYNTVSEQHGESKRCQNNETCWVILANFQPRLVCTTLQLQTGEQKKNAAITHKSTMLVIFLHKKMACTRSISHFLEGWVETVLNLMLDIFLFFIFEKTKNNKSYKNDKHRGAKRIKALRLEQFFLFLKKNAILLLPHYTHSSFPSELPLQFFPTPPLL